ncbi:MAG TPA: hypothetical protein VF028_08590 [Actinomycetota bacterium]|jgi:hypothetical protein|nr:hypothetical protein [Actinomycetota bacterium]HZN43206.1 hypothetical protein [Actinomycetota bacterium]
MTIWNETPGSDELGREARASAALVLVVMAVVVTVSFVGLAIS